MDITITKDGVFTIKGTIQPATRSKSGKTYIVATTGGFINVQSEDGRRYAVSMNIITKEPKNEK